MTTGAAQMQWYVAIVRDVNRIAAARNIWRALECELPDRANVFSVRG